MRYEVSEMLGWSRLWAADYSPIPAPFPLHDLPLRPPLPLHRFLPWPLHAPRSTLHSAPPDFRTASLRFLLRLHAHRQMPVPNKFNDEVFVRGS